MPTSAKTAKSPAKAKAAPAKPAPAKAKGAPEEVQSKAAAKKTTGRKTTGPAKAGAEKSPPPKRAGAGKAAARGQDDADLSDIEADLEGEPEAAVPEVVEKVKPLRMKISKAKERALMKEFGLDESVLSEEEMNTRRANLKALLKLGKTRGYLTHGEINDHLPDKLVDAETLEAVVSMLNDLGVAVYEQTPDAETLLLTNTGTSTATEEEAEEEAEAALSTVDSAASASSSASSSLAAVGPVLVSSRVSASGVCS